jgi:hypothetical protein
MHVTRMTDKLGKDIDPGIFETVVILNLLGIPTTQSCEGHLEHGTGAPWVDIEDTSASAQSKEVGQLFSKAAQAQREQTHSVEEIIHLFDQAHQARQAVKQIHLAVRQRLIDYLAAFYKNRHVPYDVQLVIQSRDTTGRSRLESQGADFQEIAPPEIKQRKLLEYQEEMRAFTAFLKEKYFSEDKP